MNPVIPDDIDRELLEQAIQLVRARDGHGAIPRFDIHDRLRKAREYAGIEQADLADMIGVSRTTVSNYETRRVTETRRIVLNAWALATGVSLNWILNGDHDN